MLSITPVRLPRLLDGALQEVRRLHPLDLSITLQLAPLSEAEMTLPADEPVALRQMMELFTPQGSAGIFRVCAVSQDEQGLQNVQLVHSLTTLSDALIPDEGDSVGSAEDVFRFLLSYQSPAWWRLGTVEVDSSVELAYHYDATNVLKALVDVLGELPGYHLAFDQTSLPWVLHVRADTDAVACEVRLQRNLDSLRIRRDDSQLCTRLYVNALEQPLDADTISTWGVVSRFMTVNEELDAALILQAARQYLQQHQQPQLTITLDAVELYRLTGEPLDRFTLGTLCRMALPEQHQTLSQRVVRLCYQSVYGCPDAVAVTLASHVLDTADALAGLVVDTRMLYLGQSRSRIRLKATHELVNNLQAKYSTVLIDLNAIKAELLLKANQTVVDDLMRRLSNAEIRLDGADAQIALKASQSVVDELGKRLSSAEILLDGANAQIALKANRTEVDTLTERVSSAEIAIDGANAQIALKANLSETEGLASRLSSAEIAIDGANAQIALKASAASVNALDSRISSAELSIDGLNSEITLKANKIDLQGFVTADDLETQILTVVNASYIETLAAGFLACGDIDAETVNCDAVNTGPVDCSTLAAGTASVDTLWATGAHISSLAVGGTAVSWGSQSVVTSMNGLSKEYTDIWYMDSDGTEQYARVLTNVELRYPNTTTLSYLQG